MSGTVLESDGTTPVEDSTVALYLDDQFIIATQSESDGHYSFVIATDGTYRLEAADERAVYSAIDSIAVSGGSAQTGLDLVAGDELIRGTVTSSDAGAPINNAKVSISYDDGVYKRLAALVTTDASGAFEISATEIGTYTVTINAEGFAFATQETVLTSGTPAELSFALDVGLSISGLVRKASDNALIADATVTAISDLGFEYVTTTGNDGAFEYSGLADGVYTIVASVDGYESGIVESLDLKEGDQTASFSLATGDTKVIGVVSGPAGPLSQVSVFLTDSRGLVIAQTLSSLDGAFLINGVAPGNYIAKAEALGFRMSDGASVSLEKGQTQDGISLSLDAIAITDPTPTPLPPPPPLFLDWFTRVRLGQASTQREQQLLTLGKELLKYGPYDKASRDKCGFQEAADRLNKAYRLLDEIQELVPQLDEFANSLAKSIQDVQTAYSQMQANLLHLTSLGTSVRTLENWILASNIVATLKPDFVPDLLSGQLDSASSRIRAMINEVKFLEPSWGAYFFEFGIEAYINSLQQVRGHLTVASAMNRLANIYDLTVAEVAIRILVLEYCLTCGDATKPAEAEMMHDALATASDECSSVICKTPPGEPEGDEHDADDTGPDSTETDDTETVVRTSFDPNDKLGPSAFGDAGFRQPGVLNYEIQFESDPGARGDAVSRKGCRHGRAG